MDLTTIIGILTGVLALFFGFILEGGSPGSLFHGTAALIVFGGTLGAVAASFSTADLKRVPKWLRIAFSRNDSGVTHTFAQLIHFAERARKEGLLSLEQDVAYVEDKFTRKGLQLVIDGTDPEITRSILESHITVLEKRHRVGIHLFEAAGGFSPTMGIIGTVLGLVHVLGNMANPDQLSGAIAAAFIATLYGVSAANLIWLPIANKLKQKDRAEVQAMEMTLDGILSIQAGENPTILKEKLNTHLDGGLQTIPQKGAGYPGRVKTPNQARSMPNIAK
ncbi:MAG: flagellar motor protein [Peptococcaceae bacterium]|jgi:chemotaxis protein MotA|nr:flagellar motor protein [Peptococcaceae bacterium]